MATRRTALVDADFLIYSVAAWAMSHQADLPDTIDRLDAIRHGWLETAEATDSIYCFSCPRDESFRRTVYPPYKAHRVTDPPPFLPPLKEYLEEEEACLSQPGLEADDILSMGLRRAQGQETVIISVDKDMEQVPGLLFNPNKHEQVHRITPAQARYHLLLQWLTGDTTDGFKGLKGVGPRKAEAILADGSLDVDDIYVAYFEHPSQVTFEYCLQMRACARLLKQGEWDYDHHRPLRLVPGPERLKQIAAITSPDWAYVPADSPLHAFASHGEAIECQT